MRQARRGAPLRTALLYALCAGVWILISDVLLRGLTTDPGQLTQLQSLKGGGFVALTALLLYLLLRREFRSLRRRDAQVRQIEQRLHLQTTALESAANAVVITDPEGRITWVNPAFTRLTGYTAAEVLGRNPRILKSGKHDQAFFTELWQTILSGQVWHGDIVNQRKDGSLYTEGMTITPVRDTGGAISHFIAIKQDITERKTAEAALRESEERFRTLVENVSDWVWEVNERGVYTYVSPRIREILGYEPEEVLGKSPFDFMPPEEAKRVAEIFAPITGEMKPFVLLENVNLHKDGHRVVLETSGTPILDSRGVFRGFRGIDRDVTERKRAEEALSQSEERYRRLAEFSPDAIVVHCDGRIVMVNAAGARLLGAAGPKELIGRPALALVHPEHRGLVQTRIQQILEEGRPADFVEQKLIRLDGRVINVEAGSVPFTYQGRPAVQVVARDITARKIAEETLVKRTGQLEAVRTVSVEIARELNLPALLDLIIRRAVELVGVASGQIFLWDEAERVLVPGAWCGLGDWVRDLRLRLGESISGTVAERREGMILNDYRTSAYAHLTVRERSDITAVLSEPLLYRDRLVGVISIDDQGAGRPFTEEDQNLIRLFAAQAAIAIQNARLHSAAVQRGEQMEALLRATRSVMSGLDLQRILDRIVAETAKITGCSHAKVLLVDTQAGVLRVGALRGTAMSTGDRLPLGIGHSGIVAATGQPLFSEDCPNDPRNAYAARDRELGIVTYLGLPIRVRDEVVGVLSFNTTAPRRYTPDELAYLASFADQAAIAIENARLYDTTVQRARQLATLTEVTRVLTRELDPQAVAREILTAVQVLIPGAVGRLWEWGCGDEGLRVVAGVGLRDPKGGLALWIRPEEGIMGIAASTRQPVISRDVLSDPRYRNRAWAEGEGLVSCIVLPLIYGDRDTGALAIYTRAPHDFTDEEIGLLRSFAAQAAIAVENAHLHNAALRRGQELEALLRATRTLMGSRNLKEMLDGIVAEAARMAGTPHAAVMLVDKAAQALQVAALAGDPVPPGFQIPLGSDLCGVVAQTGQPVFSPDSPNDPRNLLAQRDRELGFATYLGLPIKIQDEVLGVLTFDSTVPRHYTREEVAYLASFADQAALALENARLDEAIRGHAATLEGRIQERTQELEEARIQAEAASRHKSEFLANMSHELRTPLNSIIGFSELLRQQQVGPLTEKQARYAGHILESGKHLLELIEDILDLAKVEAGKLVLRPGSLAVAATLEDVLAIARGLSRKKAQEIQVKIEDDLPSLHADPVRFKQICFNLLSNAVKFTPERGRITLTARRVAEAEDGQPGPWLEIRVSDTGIGIRAEDLPRLFQEFVQLEAAATKRHEGTGLGLALSKRLVELHAGRIWAASAGEGQGSTFTVLLPFGGPSRQFAIVD